MESVLAHNPPNPDRFLSSSAQQRAMWAVLARYGTIEGDAEKAVSFIEVKLAEGYPVAEAGRLWEAEAKRLGLRDLLALGIARENSRPLYG